MKEKEKANIIYLIIIITCAVLVIGFCGFAIYRHSKKELSDAEKFKTEYEAFNDVESQNSDNKYPIINIDIDNPIIYKTPKGILDVLKKETAIVYFGFPTCPWCRNVVETLIKAAKEQNISKIYYVDIKNIRDAYEFNGSIKPKQTKNGTESYYEILDFFGDKLEEYYVYDEDGNMYGTGVTRLYAPTVIAIKDGEILNMHVSTVESHEDPYQKINEEQQKELYDIYSEVMESIKEETCKEDAC